MSNANVKAVKEINQLQETGATFLVMYMEYPLKPPGTTGARIASMSKLPRFPGKFFSEASGEFWASWAEHFDAEAPVNVHKVLYLTLPPVVSFLAGGATPFLECTTESELHAVGERLEERLEHWWDRIVDLFAAKKPEGLLLLVLEDGGETQQEIRTWATELYSVNKSSG